MEYVMIIALLLLLTILLAMILNWNTKKLKQMANNQKLNNLVNQFPENIEVCQSMLKKLNNESVTVEETMENKTNLYIAITNKIVIANIRDTYTRIQTIAHECLHSIQNRKLLLFNYFYSNFYILYFVLSIGLKLFGRIDNDMFQIVILSLLGGVYYFVRSYLETDAMTKARFLAKEYMDENQLCTKQECEELIEEYDKLNRFGIPLSNLRLLFNTYSKVIMYCVIALIIQFI